MCGFHFNGNIIICPTSPALRDIRLRNFSDPEFAFQGHSRSNIMAQLDSLIYTFLLMLNSNIWPNPASFQDIKL